MLVLIKAYNYDEQLMNSSKGNIMNENIKGSRVEREIELVKYATNEIKIYERDHELYMSIKRNFNEGDKIDKKERK